jgi:pyruvate dehydrogenase E2 component (dihydrolipoamide acetyltransferase)
MTIAEQVTEGVNKALVTFGFKAPSPGAPAPAAAAPVEVTAPAAPAAAVPVAAPAPASAPAPAAAVPAPAVPVGAANPGSTDTASLVNRLMVMEQTIAKQSETITQLQGNQKTTGQVARELVAANGVPVGSLPGTVGATGEAGDARANAVAKYNELAKTDAKAAGQFYMANEKLLFGQG